VRATVVAKTSSSPGINGVITFTIQRTLTFNAGATYKFELNSTNGKQMKLLPSASDRQGRAEHGTGMRALGTVFT